MKYDTCRVSIGMPVYNGERFLPEAITSVLAQTFEDFELIISDNASTDRTGEICKDFAARDPRIRYSREENNRGSGRNHNRVFVLSKGEYFKWVAHDDRCAPTFLARCVDVLDRDPSVVICYPNTLIIGENGDPIENPYRRILRDDAASPSRRFREMAWYEHLCFPIYGLIRSRALRATPVMGCYTGGDNVLLARLALLGRFERLLDYLSFNRAHARRSTRALPARMQEKRLRLTNHIGWLPAKDWWDTSAKGKITFPYWNMFRQYFTSIEPAPILWREKVKCYFYLLPWLGKYHRRMAVDLLIAADTLLAPILRTISPDPGIPADVGQAGSPGSH
jgi:glycosyltransferase involved in cell wall biosynthesis